MPTTGERDTTKVEDALKRQKVDYEFIKVVDSERKGAPWARNQGREQATSEYLFFLDDDLILEDGALKALERALRNDRGASFAYGAWTLGQYRFDPPERLSTQAMFQENQVSIGSLFRAEGFPGFDESLGKFQDWDVYLTYLLRGDHGVKATKKLIFKTKHWMNQDGITKQTADAESARYWWCRVRTKHNPTKLALYTLTRDRLDYTKLCFQSLWDKAGRDFDHYVIDNGSTDGTAEWLQDQEHRFAHLSLLDENVGISKGSNLALDTIAGADDYDQVGKFDNDCLVLTDGMLHELSGAMFNTGSLALMGPRVEGLRFQPNRLKVEKHGDHEYGFTQVIGGICHLMPGGWYTSYVFDESLPKAQGQDQDICAWVVENGGTIVYIEDLAVEHIEGTDGQQERYPGYFVRKTEEESGYDDVLRERGVLA
jgi:GT2 family glycosyltransferase